MMAMLSTPVEDKVALLCVHEPSARVALILDLVQGPEVPLAVALAAPERVVVTSIGRLDVAGAVRTALGRNTSILHLNVFACVGVCVCGPHRGWWGSGDSSMAIGDMVGRRRRSRARRIDVGSLTVHRRADVGPLIWRIEVSKRVHGAIESAIVVASKPTIGGIAWVITRAVVAGA